MRIASMGVMKSERISQLSGSTSYCCVAAMSLTVSSGGRICMSDLLKKKSSFGVLPKELIAQTKVPPTERYSLSRTNAIREKRTIRGATLNSRLPVRLAEIPSYLPATDVCQHVAGYSAHKTHFAAPSAVHLTMCILPDFQHRRLSVKASLPLSPLQRFAVLTWAKI